MADFFLNLVKVNEGVDYALWISICVAYFFIIWFIVCIWVFSDARKRFEKTITPILFFLFSIIFGPPALIFYIMVRPEHTLEEDYLINLALSGEKELKPIYFDGEHGFDIAISLSVQPKEQAQDKHKMNMSIQWMPQKMQSISEPVTQPGKEVVDAVQKESVSKKMSGFIEKLRKSFRGKVKNFQKAVESQETEVEQKEEASGDRDLKQVQTEQSHQQTSKKKKKKKKKRKKK